MWQLKRGQVNRVAATLQDNELDGDGAVYLVEFKHTAFETVNVLPVILSDTSRSTVFTIELMAGATESDRENGKVSLRHGHYDVKVYRQNIAAIPVPQGAVVDGVVHNTTAFVELAEGESEPFYYEYSIEPTKFYEQGS